MEVFFIVRINFFSFLFFIIYFLLPRNYLRFIFVKRKFVIFLGLQLKQILNGPKFIDFFFQSINERV